MPMFSEDPSNNKGVVEGIQERNAALKALAGGAMTNPPVSSKPKPSTPAKTDLVNPKARYGDRGNEKRIPDSELKEMQKPLGSYKKGGKVKKTGVYKLHKGERVLNRKQTKKMAKKGMKAVLSGKAY